MTRKEPVCGWCRRPARWTKWRDRQPADRFHRQMYGAPGPTAQAFHACDDCKPKMEQQVVNP